MRAFFFFVFLGIGFDVLLCFIFFIWFHFVGTTVFVFKRRNCQEYDEDWCFSLQLFFILGFLLYYRFLVADDVSDLRTSIRQKSVPGESVSWRLADVQLDGRRNLDHSMRGRAVLVVVVLVSLPVEAIQSFSCFLRSLAFQSLYFFLLEFCSH